MIYLIVSSIFLFYSVYMLFTITAALFYKAPVYKNQGIPKHSVLIFYPAYKPGKNLVENIRKVRKEVAGFDAKIYVLSQDGDEAVNAELRKKADYLDIKSFSNFEGNAYHHALEYAVNRIGEFAKESGRIFDSVLIMDPDNKIESSSFARLLKGREGGAQVVLSRRKSSNQKSSTSIFDGVSERINDHMLRRAKNVLKLTPELAGSGMMMETGLFTRAVLGLDKKAPGMDKQLLVNMMFECENLNILFDDEAIILDEKTENDASFNRQRLRWFGNQYYNAKKFGWKLLKSGKPGMIDYAIALWRLPRSFQVLLSGLLLPIDLLLFWSGVVAFPVFTLSSVFTGLSLLIFLNEEDLLKPVISNIIPLLKTSLVNGWLVLKSQSSSIKGTFIHTRES